MLIGIPVNKTFAFQDVVVPFQKFEIVVFGVVAGGLTTIGMLLGRRIGAAWGPRVEIIGGLVLIGIGLKILLEHTLLQ